MTTMSARHNLNWDDLRVFLAVAREGSLSAAARALRVTQPTLTTRGDRVWAIADGQIVAFDRTGTETASLETSARGDLLAGEHHLWLTDFLGASVSVVDPATTTLIERIGIGRFPIGPVVAFDHVWLPSATDGTVTVLDERTRGEERHLTLELPIQRSTHAIAVPGGASGPEVWIVGLDGDVVAVGAADANFGTVREIDVDRPINDVVPVGGRAALLPTWGLEVIVVDLATEDQLAAIPIGSTPFRAVAHAGLLYVAGDGPAERLSIIDLEEMAVIEELEIGAGTSSTAGPTQPIVVGDEIWVTNRGDDTVFVIAS